MLRGTGFCDPTQAGAPRSTVAVGSSPLSWQRNRRRPYSPRRPVPTGAERRQALSRFLSASRYSAARMLSRSLSGCLR